MNAKTRGAAGKLPTNRAISFFLFLMVAGIIGAGVSAYLVLRDAGLDARYLELTGELRVLSQQISTSSRRATAGEAAAFDELILPPVVAPVTQASYYAQWCSIVTSAYVMNKLEELLPITERLLKAWLL